MTLIGVGFVSTKNVYQHTRGVSTSVCTTWLMRTHVRPGLPTSCLANVLLPEPGSPTMMSMRGAPTSDIGAGAAVGSGGLVELGVMICLGGRG